MKQTAVKKIVYWAKNVRARPFIRALERYAAGAVLDVGGRDFFVQVVRQPRIRFTSWTNLEKDASFLPAVRDARYREIIGDGCATPFKDASFDTVVNSLVLEHTFEPVKMVQEIGRVLRPGGHALFLIPQTGVIHDIPENYYNFTRFWIEKAFQDAHLLIIELRPIGGRWTTTASHFVHFFLQAFRARGYSSRDYRRNVFFYLLFPLMALYALVGVAVCMFLSLGDLKEEPNYHLVVTRK